MWVTALDSMKTMTQFSSNGKVGFELPLDYNRRAVHACRSRTRRFLALYTCILRPEMHKEMMMKVVLVS